MKDCLYVETLMIKVVKSRAFLYFDCCKYDAKFVNKEFWLATRQFPWTRLCEPRRHNDQGKSF